ncbi:hypothetical protein SCAR479_12535 [Seiridium cardinale]|uniref:ABC transporter n=1 Tax=Seiridium cardinale TaxID=138064 RepID=A0ABR2XAF8_9PEZI
MPFSTGEENLLQLNQQDFDFNVQFEQLFFSIIPSVLFIGTSLWRTLSQARKPTVVNAPAFQLVKLGAITTYVGLELSLLILVAVGSFHVTTMFIVAAVLKLLSALFMITLSLVDHSKSPRPSVLLSSYLFLTLLLDAAQARTLFLSSNEKPEMTYSTLFSAAMALKAGILLLEAQRKSRWISWDEKEHSPEETSGIFSLGVFFWLNKMFLEGYRKVLTIKDLYPLDASMNGKLIHDEFSRNMDYAKMKGDKYGLVKVLARTLKVPLLLPVAPRLARLGFTFCQPFFIEKLLDHLSQPEIDANVSYGFIGASILIYSGIAVSTALSGYFHHRMRTMARSILVTEIYIKATKARIGTGDDSAALTLMGADMERIKVGFKSLHDMWASIIQAILAAWMLYTRIGIAFVVPMGLVVVCFGGLAVLMRFTGDSQRFWMARVQKRVGLTATVISSMKNLKISGLSVPVGNFVQRLRVEELAAGIRLRRIFIIAAIFGYTPLMISPPLTFAFAQGTLNVSKIFTSLSYLLLLTNPLSEIIRNIPQLISGLACIGRIQTFLECETREDFRQVLTDMERDPEKTQGGIEASSESDSNPAHPIVIKDGRFGWETGKFSLQNINTRVAKSSLTIVVGPIGSGKSTLCKALLGEIPFSEGSVILSTRMPHIGFCEQTAFLSNGSIKDNIVGFSQVDNNRYNDVIEAAALPFDFATLPQGDRTNIGSDGITLSGGQKQRVALARALYLQSDLLVLDDVFSGLDVGTEEQVFRQVFGPDGLLRRRRTTVILCTHSVRHIRTADHIIALGGGTIVEQGSFEQLMAGQGYVQRLGLNDSSDGDTLPERSTPQTRVQGTQPQLLHTTTTNTSSVAPVMNESRRFGDKTIYKHYFKSMGLFLAACCLFFATLWGFFTNFPTIWLTFWTDDIESGHPTHNSTYYAGIYGLLQVSAMISLFMLGVSLFIISVKRAGANLHQEALRTLIRAPLRFFTKTDTGVVTNLFSQDLNIIDTELPDATLNTLFCVAQAAGQAAIMLTSSPYLAISYPFLGALLYIVQRFYLRTSRQLRFLDLETKSPLYTHFLDTLKGVTTVRAFGFVAEDIRKNARLVDSSQRPAYLLLMIQSWLNFVLDLVVMFMAAILTTLAVLLHSKSGFAGASLVTLMSFGDTLSGIVTFYTALETSIGAIARLRTFNEDVKPEDREEEDILPPEEWPQTGVVELNGVSADYNAGDGTADTPSLALRDIHLTIKSGEKVAICGRTGSGKSSLIALLLKLLDPVADTAGNAIIDGTPLHRISRPALRQRIIAVPQEAVFLPDGSTFQANIDPSDGSTPEECQSVLEAVGFWSFVQERGGLDAGMSAGTLSAGQRQLMSLGRALLRRRIRARNLGMGGGGSEGGILLLDEVSSSVDHETERVMQDIIKAEFKNYTVIAYLDAIKCRAEELDAARRYVQSIKSTLEVINGFPSRLQVQHQQSLAAISACLKPCEDELRALETLIAKLSNSGNADPDLIDRVRERTKKLAYSFNRTKLSQLEEKLNRTVKALQLAVQSFGIEISATATDSLRTIETTTARSATELLTVKTGVAAIDNGVSVIGRELPVVRSVVQSIVPELGLRTDSLSIQLRQGNEVLRDDISRTGGSINMTMTMVQNELSGIQQTLKTQQQQNAELMRILQRQPNFLALFGTQDQHNMTPTTLLGRAISKPSNLRALCDGFESRQGVVPLRSTDQERPRIQRGTAGADTSEILLFRTTRCAICGFRTQRKMRRKQISYGSIHLYSDTTEYQKHLPNCTYFQPTKMKEQTWGLLRTGAAWFVKQAVQISFSMTSGAGGFSLSPVFTYSATVDERIAPAFQVVKSMIDFFRHEDFKILHNRSEAAQRILEAGFIKVGRLLREGLASPKDVNSRNQTLMQPISRLTRTIAMASLDDSNNIALDFLEKFLNYDIPVAQYDIYGRMRSPIWTLTEWFDDWSAAALKIVFSREKYMPLAGMEAEMECDDSLRYYEDFYRHDYVTELVGIQRDSPLIAEAFGCGPLSQAVLASDIKEVENLLKNHPHMMKEKNFYGQTPLHFVANRPSYLKLLLAASNQDTLNEPDFWKSTALDYALYDSV